MGDAKNRIIWDFFANTRDLEKGLGKAQRGFKDTGKASGALQRGFGSLSKIAGAVGLSFGAMEMARWAGDAIQLAVSAEEVDSKFKAVYGTSKDFEEALSAWADMAGITDTKARNLAATFGNLAQAQGISREGSEELALKVAELAGDMASFNDQDPEQVYDDLNKALLTTEREGMKKYGIAIEEQVVKERAKKIAMEDGRVEASKADRAMASYAIAVEQAGEANGDLERTSDSTANKQRQLKADMEEMQEAIGKKLLPTYEDLLQSAIDLEPAILAVASAAADTIEPIAELASAVSDVTGLFDGGAVSMGTLGKAGDFALGAMKKLNPVFGGLMWVTEKVTGKTVDLSESIEETTGASERVAVAVAGSDDALVDYGQSASDAADETDDLVESTETLSETMKKQADPVLGAIDSYGKYQDVLADIDEDGERTKDELLKLADATLTMQDKFNALDATNINEAVDSISSALGISKDEARDLLDELGLMDGRTISTKVLVDFMNQVDGKSTKPGQRYAVRAMASGGVIQQGEPVLVGERGPEVVTPGIQSRITPNHKIGGSGGGTVNINVTAIDPASAAEAVVDALHLAEQRGLL